MDAIFLEIDTIPGESTIEGGKAVGNKPIEVLSFSHGVSMQVLSDPSNSERTAGKPNHQDLTITKYLDLASCPLIDACNRGHNFKEIKLTVARNDDKALLPYLSYKLENAIISSVSLSGGGDRPMETLTLNYSKITWDFTSQKVESGKAGHNGAVWDLAKNVGNISK